MTVSILDIVLAIAAISFAAAGFRQGFIVGALSFVGFLVGGLAGISFAPSIVNAVDAGLGQALLAIGVVLGLAIIGQLVGSMVGGGLRDLVTWHPARLLDAGAGAFLGVVSLLIVSWFVGSAVASASIPTLTREVRQSRILASVDRVMPERAEAIYRSLSQVLDRNGFPQVFAPFATERIVPVEPPDEQVLGSRAVRTSRGSIVKVFGTAESCARHIEGTGFVYAAQRVMTNAHVVAGVRRPLVQVGGRGAQLRAQVVVFDPGRDVAVLYVPGLDARALGFDYSGKRRDAAIVAGFPRNGPFRADAARIRDELDARGPDIYDTGQVVREVFSLYATVEPGNSGGPLLSPTGNVYGVIFAKSLEDAVTGYALTADEVRDDAAQGRRSVRQVPTGRCA
jgi:S1-C subfamily serine protease